MCGRANSRLRFGGVWCGVVAGVIDLTTRGRALVWRRFGWQCERPCGSAELMEVSRFRRAANRRIRKGVGRHRVSECGSVWGARWRCNRGRVAVSCGVAAGKRVAQSLGLTVLGVVLM